MRARRWRNGLMVGCVLWLGLALQVLGQEAPAAVPAEAISWKKVVLDKRFRSEGVTVADVNKDGKKDILLGEVWFEAPSWKMHEIRKPARDYGDGLGSYSESFACWAEDFNSDGWTDVLVIRFPGAPCYWYENPQNKPGHWKEHLVADNACNETPQFLDLFGQGKRVLVMGMQPPGKGNDNQGQMVWLTPVSDPTKPWKINAISEAGAPNRPAPGTFKFSHGLGVGDVNSDRRLDVICTEGWWEQPASVNGSPWKFHAAKLGEACADMYVYDMDGDGQHDIISSSAHKFGLWWFKQRGGERGATPVFFRNDLFRELVSETHAMHCVDINGDGMKDLITGKRWWSHGRAEPGSDWPAMLYWFEASRGKDKQVRFTPRIIDIDSGVGTQFEVTDVNGDGLLDVVTSNKKGTFLLLQVRKK